MNKPDLLLCKKLIKNLKTLKGKGSIFAEGIKKQSEERDKNSLYKSSSSDPTMLARIELLTLIKQLELKSCCNVTDSRSTLSDFDGLIKEAEGIITPFK